MPVKLLDFITEIERQLEKKSQERNVAHATRRRRRYLGRCFFSQRRGGL